MTTFVIIESPYAGDIARNLEYARAAMADCFARGEIPFASHALYTQEGVLNDALPEERAKGIEAGFTVRRALGRCLGFGYLVKTVVYTDRGLSSGMKEGISDSADSGIPIEFRSLNAWVSK